MAITKTVSNKISVSDYGDDNLLHQRNETVFEGLSTDSKPTENIATNSRFFELDTGKTYYFSAGSWTEIPSSGGGGGGDTSWATISFTGNGYANIIMPYDDSGFLATYGLHGGEDYDVQCPLGEYGTTIYSNKVLNITGNYENGGNVQVANEFWNGYTITGDCTINISSTPVPN